MFPPPQQVQAEVPRAGGAPVAVSIIIVNWHSKEFLRQCLASITHFPPTENYEVIVIDGASFDGSAELVATAFPNFRFLQSQKNLGFAGCNNIAAQQARGKYLLFLNPDTEVLPGALHQLLRAVEAHPEFQVAGPALCDHQRQEDPFGARSAPTPLNLALDSSLLRRLLPSSYLWGTPSHEIAPGLFQVEAVSGASLLITRLLFCQLAGFRTDYFMYGEDMDLCLRARRAGSRILYNRHSLVIHHGGASTKSAPSDFSIVHLRKSWYKYMLLNHGRPHAIAFRLLQGLGAFFRLLLAPLQYLRPKQRSDAFIRDRYRKWSTVLLWSLGLRR